MLRLITRIVMCVVCVVSFRAYGANDGPSTLLELKQAVDAIRTETGAPAFGIALVDRNGPVWVTGVGEANRESNIPATADTIFRIGSVSKMLSGIAVMQLVDAGKLSLDDTLREIAPSIVFENPWAESHPVRIAHLLEHTTGWDVHPGEYSVPAPDTLRLEEGLNSHPDSRLSRWPPGTRYSYSNTGPVVAAFVVEVITGMRYEDYMAQFVFEPLAMSSSSFFKTLEYDARGATLYSQKGPLDYFHIYSRPSSSLNTSANDMAQLMSMMIGRGAFKGVRLLSEAAITRMEQSETTLGAEAGIHSGYGLTLDVTGFQGRNTAFYGHSGGLPGAITEFVYQPSVGKGFVFMINEDNPRAYSQLSDVFRTYLLKDEPAVSVQPLSLPEKYRQLSGLYTPINPIFELGKIQFDITHVMRFSADETYLHRSPFFGGWQSNDYAIDDGPLISDWSGLPSIVIVNDPVAGEAVQVEGVLYQKTSVLIVVGRLVFIVMAALLVLLSFIYPLWRLLVRIKSKKPEPIALRLRLLPTLLSSLLLILPVFILFSGLDIKRLMESSIISWAIFIVSVLYPLAAIVGFVYVARIRKIASEWQEYWYVAVMACTHVWIATYLACYGFFAYRLWA